MNDYLAEHTFKNQETESFLTECLGYEDWVMEVEYVLAETPTMMIVQLTRKEGCASRRTPSPPP